MNKRQIINKVKELEGLTKDEKEYLVNIVNYSKEYGLVWENKLEIVEEELKTKLPILKEVKEKAIIKDTKKENYPNHILIEGDNLHALTTLSFTHENKIDIIYIDPPYNTGNKDFVYNDYYIDKEDDYKHSKWLSFMSKRLEIAKILLKDDGVIFISIDDNEQAQLKLLCDEIFGEDTFVGNIVWEKGNAQNDSKGIQKNHEYILSYFRSKGKLKSKIIKEEKVLKDNKGSFYLGSGFITGGAGGTLNNRINLGHSIYLNEKTKDFIVIDDYDKELAKTFNDESKVYKENQEIIQKGYKKIIRPTKKGDKLGCWTWSKDRMNENKDLIYISEKHSLRQKIYIEDETKINKNKVDVIKYSPPKSVFKTSSAGGSKLLNTILGHKIFNNPKPLSLIKPLILFKQQSKKNIIILDFFAGSGTTGQAVMELNKEDGGNRQFILCTNNENQIAEKVTYERNKRVINGYINSKAHKVEGLTNNNLRYFQCDYVERKPSLKNKKKLTKLATELLCIKEACYYEITSEINKHQWNRLFTNRKGVYNYIVYDDLYIDMVVKDLTAFIESKENKLKVKVYVFSNGEYPYTEDFENIHEYVELCALPDVIYKAYQNVLPKISKF